MVVAVDVVPVGSSISSICLHLGKSWLELIDNLLDSGIWKGMVWNLLESLVHSIELLWKLLDALGHRIELLLDWLSKVFESSWHFLHALSHACDLVWKTLEWLGSCSDFLSSLLNWLGNLRDIMLNCLHWSLVLMGKGLADLLKSIGCLGHIMLGLGISWLGGISHGLLCLLNDSLVSSCIIVIILGHDLGH